MTLNIVVTSKPCDGLFYYSYEYCELLNSVGIEARVIVVTHRHFEKKQYIDAIKQKYINCRNLFFDKFTPDKDDIIFVTGRSMITLAWQDFDYYKDYQKLTLKKLFSKKIIPVYSENHPIGYAKAIKFFNPQNIIDLCDKDVYPNGVGEHFEKTINFDIYKELENKPEFEFLFLGTNARYYNTVEKIISNFSNHGILVYDESYLNSNNNNIKVPVNNLLGKFNTYVYTKDSFDPAPRLFQECRYFGKNIIYQRSKNILDGGKVYWERGLKTPNIEPIQKAMERLYVY